MKTRSYPRWVSRGIYILDGCFDAAIACVVFPEIFSAAGVNIHHDLADARHRDSPAGKGFAVCYVRAGHSVDIHTIGRNIQPGCGKDRLAGARESDDIEAVVGVALEADSGEYVAQIQRISAAAGVRVTGIGTAGGNGRAVIFFKLFEIRAAVGKDVNDDFIDAACRNGLATERAAVCDARPGLGADAHAVRRNIQPCGGN